MGLGAKCERETEREVRFESWRKLVVAASDGASNGWWQCQWWPVVGLVASFVAAFFLICLIVVSSVALKRD